jgi:hypothetical protein
MTTMEPTMQKEEGKVTRQIEERTSKVPSGAYMGLAFGSMVLSAGFMIAGNKQVANFIGQWVPTILVLGLYNKVVKMERELLSGSAYGSYR